MIPVATIGLVIEGITAVITGAPRIVAAAQGAVSFIRSMFESGAIDKATQDKLLARVDAICTSALNGETPPHWEVEPDPVNDVTPIRIESTVPPTPLAPELADASLVLNLNAHWITRIDNKGEPIENWCDNKGGCWRMRRSDLFLKTTQEAFTTYGVAGTELVFLVPTGVL